MQINTAIDDLIDYGIGINTQQRELGISIRPFFYRMSSVNRRHHSTCPLTAHRTTSLFSN